MVLHVTNVIDPRIFLSCIYVTTSLPRHVNVHSRSLIHHFTAQACERALALPDPSGPRPRHVRQGAAEGSGEVTGRRAP